MFEGDEIISMNGEPPSSSTPKGVLVLVWNVFRFLSAQPELPISGVEERILSKGDSWNALGPQQPESRTIEAGAPGSLNL